MEKTLFAAALASVALAGCVKNETEITPNADSPITFAAPLVSSITRVYNGEITNPYPENEKFVVFANLYLNAGGSHLYDYTRMQSATGIKEAFHSGQLTLDNIGTMIRRRFEALLLEVCKILSIGANEEASTLINRLLNDRKPIYLRKSAGKIDIADDLVQEIYQLASKRNTSGDKLSGDILKKIASFHTKQSLGKLIPIIRQFREYEKLVIHELSHGYSGMPPFNQKEVEASLVLLEKMEQCVKSLRTKNGGM